jgi:hypothetical protein
MSLMLPYYWPDDVSVRHGARHADAPERIAPSESGDLIAAAIVADEQQTRRDENIGDDHAHLSGRTQFR